MPVFNNPENLILAETLSRSIRTKLTASMEATVQNTTDIAAIGSGGSVADGDKGDITVSASGATWTVDAGAITLAKQANMATGSLVYRKTAAAGSPEVQTLATLKTDLGLTGTNSGDQTSIVGLTGTKSEFNIAATDGNFQFLGDAPTAHTHLLSVGATDVTVTAANLNILDDGLNTTLHFHDADRARANHTGTQLASTVSDFNTAADARVVAGITGKQNLDATLTALAGLDISVGVVEQTGTDIFTKRAIGVVAATSLLSRADGDGRYATSAQGTKADSALQPAAIGVSVQGYTAVLAGTTASYTTAEQSKLVGIAAGATANSSDATLLARLNHTGTQLASTVSDFSAATAATAAVAANTAKVTNATHSGDATGATVLTLATVNANVGAFGSATAVSAVTLNGKGLATAASSVAIAIPSTQVTDFSTAVSSNSAVAANTAKVSNANHTGDATGDTVLTLATVNANIGSFGLAGSVGQFTTNAKGLITAAANVAISVASAAISDSTVAGRAFLTAATVAAQTAILNPFTSALKGLVPASGGGTTGFLRADGTWSSLTTDRSYGQLAANYTLASAITVQKLFNWSTNGAVTLATGRYQFRTMVYVTAMSATSGNAAFSLAGTATLANQVMNVIGIDSTTPLAAATSTGSAAVTSATAASMVTAGVGTGMFVEIGGMFNVTVTGTIIPSIQLVTAAAAIVMAGSYFECIRIADTGSVTLGTWT